MEQLCRFVGYLEEQAVVTYSDILQKMEEGKLPMWSNLPAPEIATNYWKLEEGAMMRDVILAIRYALVILSTTCTYPSGLMRLTTGWSTTHWGTWTLRRRTLSDQESKILLLIRTINKN